MFHLVKPAEGYGLDILVSATVATTEEERLRLAALGRYEILDTPPDAASDRITALAADLFNVPHLDHRLRRPQSHLVQVASWPRCDGNRP